MAASCDVGGIEHVSSKQARGDTGNHAFLAGSTHLLLSESKNWRKNVASAGVTIWGYHPVLCPSETHS